MRLNAIIGKLARGLFRSPLERERELRRRNRELSGAIEESPESTTLYVLRGELNLKRKAYERAKADFEKALALLGEPDDSQGWQLMEQVVRDRALYGLALAREKLEPVQ